MYYAGTVCSIHVVCTIQVQCLLYRYSVYYIGSVYCTGQSLVPGPRLGPGRQQQGGRARVAVLAGLHKEKEKEKEKKEKEKNIYCSSGSGQIGRNITVFCHDTMLVRVLANLHIGRLVDYWPTPTQGGW